MGPYTYDLFALHFQAHGSQSKVPYSEKAAKHEHISTKNLKTSKMSRQPLLRVVFFFLVSLVSSIWPSMPHSQLCLATHQNMGSIQYPWYKMGKGHGSQLGIYLKPNGSCRQNKLMDSCPKSWLVGSDPLSGWESPDWVILDIYPWNWFKGRSHHPLLSDMDGVMDTNHLGCNTSSIARLQPL